MTSPGCRRGHHKPRIHRGPAGADLALNGYARASRLFPARKPMSDPGTAMNPRRHLGY